MLAFARKPSIRTAARAVMVALSIAAVVLAGAVGPSGSLPALSAVAGRGLPLAFEPDVHAAAPSHYLVRGVGGTIFFHPSEMVLAFAPDGDRSERETKTTLDALSLDGLNQSRSVQSSRYEPQTLRTLFVGADSGASIEAYGELPGKVNYLRGKERSEWRTGIPTYASISYSGLYPGIDLAYSGSEGHLKGTYYAGPNADPSLIRWRYDGAGEIGIDDAGNLVVHLVSDGASSGRLVTEMAPVAWQEIGGERVPVSVRYELSGDGTVGFAIGSYDRALPLVIDPTLVYSSYLGGYYEDGAHEIKLDGQGNIYVTGYTFSPDFPTTPGVFQWSLGSPFGEDVFVTKLASDGASVIYSTFVGGTFSERGEALALDAEGNAYVTGWTSSGDFPLRNPYQPTCQCTPEDGFVFKLNHDGSDLVYSTYLGGQAGDDGFGIVVNDAGSAYVTGRTSAPDFPTTANAYQPNLNCSNSCGADAFVTIFSPDGTSLVYSTYLGGGFAPGRVGNELGFGIAVDASGKIYVIGSTNSADFPTTANAYQPSWQGNDDAFISKFDTSLPPQQQLLYSTYFGGFFFDEGFGISSGGPGIIYVTGHTDSPSGFPITPGVVQPAIGGGLDAYAAKLNTNLSGGPSLLYSTYLGGSGNDIMGNIVPAVTGNIVSDLSGNAYLSGRTVSTNFPLANPIQATNHGEEDVFVSDLNPTASVLAFSTYLGGVDDENGNALATDNQGNILVAGRTDSTDFPVADPLQSDNAGESDAFVARVFNNLFTPVATNTSTRTPSGTPPTATPTVCTPQNNYSMLVETGATMVPGTTNIGLSCDNCITSVTLPFSVTLYDQAFSTINVSSDGNLQFLSSAPGPGTDSCFPQPGFNYVIAPYLVDLDMSDGGVFTSLDGQTPFRIFTIEWRGCQYDPITYQCTIPIDLEVRLYENSPQHQIEFIYDQVSNYGVVGLQKGTGQLYKLYNCFGSGNLYSGLKVTFLLPTCATPLPTSTGTPPTNTPVTPTANRTATPTPDACHNPDVWQSEPPMITARAKLAGAVANGKLYVISGQNADPDSPQDMVEAFDPSTGTWTSVASIPTAVREAGAATVDGRIYVAGGLSTSYARLSTMQIYDSATDTWSQGAPLPAPRAGAAVVAYNGKIYIIAGEQSPSIYQTDTVWEYDPLTNGYTVRNPLPHPETDLKAAAIGSMIYVVGGDETFIHNAYNPATNTWSSIAPPPVPNYSLPAIFVLNDELWLLAGSFSYERPYPPSQEVLIYSPVRDNWRYGPLLNAPRFYGPAAGAIGSRGYLVGGVDAYTPGGIENFNFLDSMESIAYMPCGTPDATVTATSTATAVGTATAVASATAAPSTGTATTTSVTILTPTPTSCSIQFTDVPEDHTFYTYIRCLACRGIVAGYADGTFHPGNNVTRGQAAKIVANSAGYEDPIPPDRQTFNDVSPGSTFWLYIERVTLHGAISGYDCGGEGEPCPGRYYRPANNLTRGQLAKIDSEAFGYSDPIPPDRQTFNDVPPGSTFWLYIERLALHNVISGYQCGGDGEPCPGVYYRPGNNITRGQGSKVLANTFFPQCQPPPAR